MSSMPIDRVVVEERARVLAVGADAADDRGEVDDDVRPAVGERGVDAVGGRAGRSRPLRGTKTSAPRRRFEPLDDARPRKPAPPVTITRRPDQIPRSSSLQQRRKERVRPGEGGVATIPCRVGLTRRPVVPLGQGHRKPDEASQEGSGRDLATMWRRLGLFALELRAAGRPALRRWHVADAGHERRLARPLGRTAACSSIDRMPSRPSVVSSSRM